MRRLNMGTWIPLNPNWHRLKRGRRRRLVLEHRVYGGFQLRIGATLYYGFICVLAVHRCILVFIDKTYQSRLSYLDMLIFAGLALASWYLVKQLRRISDRIAALLYGIFYVVRIGTRFADGLSASILVGAGCIIILGGMIAMLVGLIHAISRRERRAPGRVDTSQ